MKFIILELHLCPAGIIYRLYQYIKLLNIWTWNSGTQSSTLEGMPYIWLLLKKVSSVKLFRGLMDWSKITLLSSCTKIGLLHIPSHPPDRCQMLMQNCSNIKRQIFVLINFIYFSISALNNKDKEMFALQCINNKNEWKYVCLQNERITFLPDPYLTWYGGFAGYICIVLFRNIHKSLYFLFYLFWSVLEMISFISCHGLQNNYKYRYNCIQ